MKLTKQFLLQLRRKLPAIGLCFAAFLIFGLYYLGVYDISFIKRPAEWETNGEMLYAAFAPESESEGESHKAPESEAEETERDKETKAPKDESAEPEDDTINNYSVLPLSSELANKGYYRSDATFANNFKFARLDTSFSLPKYYSYSKKTYDKTVPIYYDDGTEATTEVQTVTEDRLGIELYMGYILLDDVGTLYMIGPDGTILNQYDDSVYVPAYTRDTKGRPLFYKTYKYKVEYPTSLGKEDEEGNKEWLKTEKLELEGKKYYYLHQNGYSFIESDYNDATDNRGLYFDYPAYYGVSTSQDSKKQLQRYYKETTEVITTLVKKNKKTQKITTVTPSILWLYKEKNDKKFDPDAEDTLYPYSAAYNYSEGYATVKMDFKWTHKPEDKKKDPVTYTSTELCVIDEKGKQMFSSRKGFLSDLNWFANEFYCDPLIPDKTAIGSYYFDCGLMRIRRQYYDRYIYTEYDNMMIGADEDLLIYPDGTEFFLPPGYDLISYYDGMILLEKDGKYGYMDHTGRWVIQPTLEGASTYMEGVAAMKKDGKWGMADKNGNTVIPFRYDYVSDVSSGIVAAYSTAGGWELYVKMCA